MLRSKKLTRAGKVTRLLEIVKGTSAITSLVRPPTPPFYTESNYKHEVTTTYSVASVICRRSWLAGRGTYDTARRSVFELLSRNLSEWMAS